MTNVTMKAATVSVITALGLAASAPAAAGEPGRVYKSVEVFHGDLDLSKAAHEKILGQRINGAVRKVCGHVNIRDLNEVRDHSRCTQEARLSGKRAKVTIMANAAKANGSATRAIR